MSSVVPAAASPTPAAGPPPRPRAHRRAAARVGNPDDGLLLAGLAVLAFSLSTPMTKLAVRHLDPVLAGMGRAVPPTIAGALLLRATGQARPTPHQVRRLLLVVIGVVIGFPLLTAWALHRVPAAHCSLAIGVAPLITAGFGMWLAHERPSGRYWAASLRRRGRPRVRRLGASGRHRRGADRRVVGVGTALKPSIGPPGRRSRRSPDPRSDVHVTEAGAGR
jgi:uncharacterized membrane protein